ncbi:adenosine kinase [Streptomyces griseofuscus]|uniref:adenosine kinase n=1 Tax=Streptomyces TaxID=1883 RepID=UPI00081E60BE|nr:MULTISPECIES: adenosine kinase [unclassified Streptomyces]MBJ6999303.1 adenosine kinase [Streptomyces sp. CRPSP2-6A1]MYQ91323.1 adenosine kinase [Streptomyces sp. SID4946]SCF66633.1 Sugar or nucleoside kinase, ribokinase family [Streptomyces sp. DconLS]SCF88313.1 Sugar or nucleoside kinase, ribokinase family [Streptomyces sp. LamerLS-31b]
MTTETDVLVLGGAGVDTVVHVPELPVPYADSYMIRPGIVTRAGQSGDFVALGVSALGLRAHHIDLVGADPEGDLVRALHRDRGIPLTDVPSAAGTKRAVNLVGPDGRRLSLYDDTRSQESDRLPEDTLRALAASSRHAHVVITHPCSYALPVLREAGLTVSTDLHNWDGVNPYHEPFALAADLVFLSTTALADPEHTMRDIAARGRARIVVATAGAEGAYLLVDGELTHVPAVAPPSPVVDSNGAGDAFAAAFLLGWLDGLDPLRCARYGAIAGAHACTVPSTRADAISRDQLLARVAESDADEQAAKVSG